ncbi:MAG: hypothetical protein A2086_14675 [Spirochaetes bacterium GWD1_27_9]|nr:MAG: hypothetical protein A2Z98_04725 [Spirochaetes bacterium GWB1_27_13]OHD24944.1 MAG: hypothetical protein A2Y34_06190 [Spirochaetes bacterium GWC1_27_15]OHD38552.1 MAG: hypothetical protein A2086_14675 [Spirochaetes bacterium GWD1_27_9]
MSDTEIKIKGFEILSKYLGMVEMEKFISIIQNEKFDYTEWRQNLFNGMSGEEISKMAMDYIKNMPKA